MHQAAAAGALTDSMRMYLAGVEGGRPRRARSACSPSGFTRGPARSCGPTASRSSSRRSPTTAGEEPEVAACYVVDDAGHAVAQSASPPGNEFADHVMEKKNYLYLAHSKLRECAIGPELALDEPIFAASPGTVTIRRERRAGVDACRFARARRRWPTSLANLEHHHFKYAAHRIAGAGARALLRRLGVQLWGGREAGGRRRDGGGLEWAGAAATEYAADRWRPAAEG